MLSVIGQSSDQKDDMCSKTLLVGSQADRLIDSFVPARYVVYTIWIFTNVYVLVYVPT